MSFAFPHGISLFFLFFCVAHGSNYGLDRGNHIHPIFVGHTAGARAEEGRDDGFVGGNREISEGRGWRWRSCGGEAAIQAHECDIHSGR